MAHKKHLLMFRIKQIPSIVRVFALLILSLMISFGITSSSFFKDIDNIFYDFWFSFRNIGRKVHMLDNHITVSSTDDKICDDIIIIGIDEVSINRFHTYPWSRMKYINFLKYLSSVPPEKRPAAILLDILFVDKSKKTIEEEFYLNNPEPGDRDILDSPEFMEFKELIEKYQIDEPLGKAIKECGRVFLPSHFMMKQGKEKQETGFKNYKAELDLLKSFSIYAEKNELLPEYKGIMPPIIDISAQAEGIGFVTIEESGVEILRKIPLFAQIDEQREAGIIKNNLSQYYLSIDLLIALKYYDVSLENITIKWGSHVILNNAFNPQSRERGDIIIPIDKQGNLRINYRAAHKAFTVRSFADISKGRVPLEYFTGKYVLVGIMAAGASHDFWISPIGGMYGIEHHANILNTLFNRDFLYTFPLLIIYVFIILFAFTTGLITYKLKFLRSSIIIIAILIFLFVISLVTFYYNIVFPFTHILFTVLITFIIILIYKGFTGELEILGLSRDIQYQIAYNKELKEDLTELMENTINATIEQVSDIDGYTGLHNEVLGILGNEFHNCKDHIYFSKAEAEILCLARLHDIGKINVNPNILRKINRLSGSEYEEIKWHTIAGGRYLERFKKPVFKDAARLAFGHQESWDGVNGYPKGIPNACDDIEVRNGKEIRWNLILDFMSVLDTFHAMASNRPYRKGLSIEIVFRELVNNANTQFSARALEEFFSFFYKLYQKGIIKIVGNHDTDSSPEKNTIFVYALNPDIMDNFIQIHIKMMELFNRCLVSSKNPQNICCFDELRSKLNEYILIDSQDPEIRKIKDRLYAILIEKQKIKLIMTTYLNPESKMKVVERLDTLDTKQETLKEKLFVKKKYKQLFIKKIIIEYYDILSSCTLGDITALISEFTEESELLNKQKHELKQQLKDWYLSSIESIDFIIQLSDNTKEFVRYNNVCRLLNSIGINRYTACYLGNIFLNLYNHFDEEERENYFKKIELLRIFIEKMQFPDSPRIIHSIIAHLDTALMRKIKFDNDDMLREWEKLFIIIKTCRDHMLLPIPGDLKKILNQKERPVPGYNIFTLVLELISAYIIEKQDQMGNNWISLFRIIDNLNTLKTKSYSYVLMAIRNKDKTLLSHTMGKSALFFNDSFSEYSKHNDFLTYLLQVEEKFLTEKIKMPFLGMMIIFLDLAIWKKVFEIEKAYTVLTNIERKDYISDFQGSIIRMFREKEDDPAGSDVFGGNSITGISTGGVDIFQQAIEWVEETLKIM